MSIVMYLNRVPKHKGATAKDIRLIESYLAWQYENKTKGRYSCATFEEWCNHSESELPSKEVIKYYKSFWTVKHMYMEVVGDVEHNSIFEQLARFVKSNPIFNWFYNNVLNKHLDEEYYEVTKEQLEELLATCKKVKDGGITFVKEDKYGIDSMNEYIVNEDFVKQLLPTYCNKQFYFGPNKYDSWYAYQILNAIDIINNILADTDFEKQIIYLNFKNV